jgi:hypothetical protein
VKLEMAFVAQVEETVLPRAQRRARVAVTITPVHYLPIATFGAAYGNPIEATPSTAAIRIPRI